jgi:membrane protease YdiL (CAAX protease family)
MPTTVNELLAWWPVLLVYALVALGAWVALRRLLPPQRSRAVPWIGLEVFAVFLVSFLLSGFVFQLFLESGVLKLLYGPDTVARLRATDDTGAARDALDRVNLLVSVVSFPLQVAGILGLLRLASGTLPYQLGLTLHRAWRNVLLGFLVWLIVTPPVLVLNVLVETILSSFREDSVSEHPLFQLAQDRLLPAERGLLVFAAVVAAPVLEELLFRGVAQRWATRHPWGGWAMMTAALFASVLHRLDEIGKVLNRSNGRSGWADFLQAFAPSLFVLLMVPVFVWVWRKAKRPFAPALVGTSLFFAAMHSFAWPSPVALFVLALGLGWLAQRTQSLVGPIVLHALFNGVACVQLIWGM